METSLRASAQQSLDAFVHDNAVLLAEQLFAEWPTLENLAFLARCHIAAGEASTAQNLLQHYHPLQDVLPPTSASPAPTSSAAMRRPLRPGIAVSSPLGQCLYMRGVAEAKTERWGQATESLTLLCGDGTGAVAYWLGLCAKHNGVAEAATEYFTESITTNPAMLVSVEAAARFEPRAAARACEKAYAPAAGSAGAATGANRGSGGTPTTAQQGGTSRPTGPAGRSSAAIAQHQQQQSQQQQSAALHPDALQWLRKCASVLTSLWSFNTAAARDLLDQMSASPWAREQTALACFHAGDMAGAVGFFRALLEGAPWWLNRESIVSYSTALWFAKKDAALGALAQRMIRHHKHSPYTMCVIGNAYSLANNAASAHAMFSRATQVAPTFAYAHTLRGHEAMALGQRDEASECFRRALSADGRHYSAFAGLGDYYAKTEQLGNARAHLAQAIQINDLPVIMNRLASTYHSQGFASEADLRRALSVYEDVLAKHPRNFAATHQRATVLLRLGHVEEALSSLENLAVEVGEDAALHMTVGHCLARLGRTTKAIAAYRRASDLDPRRANAAKSHIERLGASDAQH